MLLAWVNYCMSHKIVTFFYTYKLLIYQNEDYFWFGLTAYATILLQLIVILLQL